MPFEPPRGLHPGELRPAVGGIVAMPWKMRTGVRTCGARLTISSLEPAEFSTTSS
jgi:hypothetical protein